MTTVAIRNFGEITRWQSIIKSHYLLLGAIMLLAFILRLYKLGEWSFWIDEMYTLEGAKYTEDWPLPRLPIYLVLTRLFTDLSGVSEWSARLPSAIIGGLTVPLMYWHVRRIFGGNVALITVVLLAFSPWHIWASQNARFYVLLFLLYNLGVLLTFIGLEERRPWFLVSALVLLGLAGRERELGFFFVPVFAVYILLLSVLPFAKPDWLRARRLLLLFIPAAAFLLYDVYYYSQTGISSVRTWVLFFVGHPIDNPVRILILILFNLGLPLVALAISCGLWLTLQHSRPGLYICMVAVIPVLLLLGLSPFVFTVDRYAFVTLLGWIVLAAIAVDRLIVWLPQQGKWLAAGVLCLILADSAGGLLMYYQLNNGNRPDWRGAFSYVEMHQEPTDRIVSTWPEIGHYYLGQNADIIKLDDIQPESLDSGDRRVWFVVDSQAVWFAPGHKKQWMDRNAELLFVWYLRMREQIDLKVYKYEPGLDRQN